MLIIIRLHIRACTIIIIQISSEKNHQKKKWKNGTKLKEKPHVIHISDYIWVKNDAKMKIVQCCVLCVCFPKLKYGFSHIWRVCFRLNVIGT